MKRYRLSYLPLFDEDLAEAWSYIAKKLRNPEAANKLVADVEAAILKRLNVPEFFVCGRFEIIEEMETEKTKKLHTLYGGVVNCPEK